MTRQLLVCIVIGIATGASGCSNDLATSAKAVDCGSYTFPSTSWKATNYQVHKSNAELRGRRRAADALAKCQVIIGMAKSQVTAMLGSPHEKRAGSWLYVVGPERGAVQVDDEVLLIRFRHNRATRVVQGET